MTTVAFVFARGGSKGLPGKNLRKLGGIPLVAHSIGTAKRLPEISEVYVSTDSAEIAEVAGHAGALVIERPAELAEDDSPEWLAWQHAIAWVISTGLEFDTFVSLPATSPLRSDGDVRRCLDALSPDADIVVTMTESARNPWFNMLRTDPHGSVALVNQPHVPIHRRQDAPACYDMCTVAYVARAAFILRHHGLWEGRVTGVLVPRSRAVDIDDDVDLAVAEALLAKR